MRQMPLTLCAPPEHPQNSICTKGWVLGMWDTFWCMSMHRLSHRLSFEADVAEEECNSLLGVLNFSAKIHLNEMSSCFSLTLEEPRHKLSFLFLHRKDWLFPSFYVKSLMTSPLKLSSLHWMHHWLHLQCTSRVSIFVRVLNAALDERSSFAVKICTHALVLKSIKC